MATIGGVAFRLFDRLPEPGDQVTHEGFRFTVKARSGLRISEIQVQKVSSSNKHQVDAVDDIETETIVSSESESEDQGPLPEVASDRKPDDKPESGDK